MKREGVRYILFILKDCHIISGCVGKCEATVVDRICSNGNLWSATTAAAKTRRRGHYKVGIVVGGERYTSYSH